MFPSYDLYSRYTYHKACNRHVPTPMYIPELSGPSGTALTTVLRHLETLNTDQQRCYFERLLTVREFQYELNGAVCYGTMKAAYHADESNWSSSNRRLGEWLNSLPEHKRDSLYWFHDFLFPELDVWNFVPVTTDELGQLHSESESSVVRIEPIRGLTGPNAMSENVSPRESTNYHRLLTSPGSGRINQSRLEIHGNNIALSDFEDVTARRFVNMVGELLAPLTVPSGVDLDAVDIPLSFLCPITYELMLQPVVLEDGYTYGYDAVIRWLNVGNLRSPSTNSVLRERGGRVVLLQNHNLRSQISDWLSSLTT